MGLPPHLTGTRELMASVLHQLQLLHFRRVRAGLDSVAKSMSYNHLRRNLRCIVTTHSSTCPRIPTYDKWIDVTRHCRIDLHSYTNIGIDDRNQFDLNPRA